MSKVQYINEGFTAGEISPDLQGRVSSDIYKESVSSMENMVATVQGATARRPGTQFIAEASQTNAASGHRLIPYRISASRAVVLHAGPDTLTVYDQNGPVTAAGAGASVVVNTNPNFAAGLTGWTERDFIYPQSGTVIKYNSQQADMSWDTVKLAAHFKVKNVHGGRSTSIPVGYKGHRAGLVQAVTLAPSTQYELTFSATSPTTKVEPQHPQTVPGFVRVVEVSAPTNLFPTATTYVANILTSLPFTFDAQSGTVLFTTPGWGGPTVVHLEMTLADRGDTNQDHSLTGQAELHGMESFMNFCRLTQTGLTAGLVTFASPWAGFDINELSFIQTPEVPSKLILAHPDVATRQLTYSPPTDTWSLATSTFTAAPWGGGEFPGVVSVHLGRLVLASSRVRPERVWFSKSLDYFNFTAGSNPGDAFFGDLSEPGRILWARSMWSLVLGAESGLWDISAFTGAILGPGNARLFKHVAHYSSNTYPAFVNNEVAYAAQGGQRLYSVRREGDDNRYVDKELSFTARHLTTGGLRSTAWAEFPNSTLWSSTQDAGQGTLVAATYDSKLLAMAGWHRHDVGGPVQAVAATNISGIDQVFLLVNRYKGSTLYLAVERMVQGSFLDSAITIASAAPTAIIGGLGHLEGLEVYALEATGIVYGPFTVTGAQITLPDAVTAVTVGLPFLSRIVTKRPEGLSRSGTVQGMKKRWNKIFVRLAPGAYPLINGVRPPERNPATPMNEGQGATYEDIEITTLGWSKGGEIVIEEFLPVPLTIASIFGHVAAEVL